ncbi:hypothetical protein GCM10011521_12210 [Arenimonas soli]|uniref:Uncharacterized protein n=1 Tax=Arenimonas soli TaxID=2269504 RepID=A0ABQ1HFN4_9GAMM|nr:hypothetical protein GCM10011521_12210 [Arenimonas soli]
MAGRIVIPEGASSATIIPFPGREIMRDPDPSHPDFIAWAMRGIEHMHAIRDWCRDNNGCTNVPCTCDTRFEPCDRNQRGPVILVPRRDPSMPVA